MKQGRITVIDIIAGIFLVVAVSFYYVILRTEVLKLGYKLSKAQKSRDEMIELNAKLKLELSALKAPIRIEPLAREMGLCYPTQNQIVEINKK